MLTNANLQTGLVVIVLLILVKPLGLYMALAAEGNAPLLSRVGAPFEKLIYRAAAIDPTVEMDWKRYAVALLLFNFLGALVLYLLQRAQAWLPLNPQSFPNVSADSAFNTAISFVTNTSWQGYAGETTMGYLVQMLGITVQSFLSAASGIAVLLALIRGFARRGAQTVGNLWVDLTRSTLYILLPLSLLFAVVFMGQGVIQNFVGYRQVQTLQLTTWQQPKLDAQGNPVLDAAGHPDKETLSTQQQLLPMGPVASQESIKLLSGDGGGFFNANSAHPYENPTPLTNFLQMLAILVIPAGLCYTFGVMVGTAISVLLPAGLAGIANPGAHGFSEILYAFSSAANNNGSAFAGLSANTPYYNTMLALVMWFGRFAVIVPVLAIAGSLAPKVRRAPGPGTLPTHGALFVGLLIGAVAMVASLTYLPALALGPIVEHLTITATH